jgi:hypothetical protein
MQIKPSIPSRSKFSLACNKPLHSLNKKKARTFGTERVVVPQVQLDVFVAYFGANLQLKLAVGLVYCAAPPDLFHSRFSATTNSRPDFLPDPIFCLSKQQLAHVQGCP